MKYILILKPSLMRKSLTEVYGSGILVSVVSGSIDSTVLTILMQKWRDSDSQMFSIFAHYVALWQKNSKVTCTVMANGPYCLYDYCYYEV